MRLTFGRTATDRHDGGVDQAHLAARERDVEPAPDHAPPPGGLLKAQVI